MNTLFIGRHLVHLRETPSTNDYALRAFSGEDIPEGACVLADFQSCGKGQRGNEWTVEPGKNLTCSFLLNPRFLRSDRYYALNKLMAVSAIRALEKCGVKDVRVKWPNDLYKGNKKLGGILIENSFKGQTIGRSIAGIGINVNQRNFDNAGTESAGSLALTENKEFDLRQIFEHLCEQLEVHYLKLKKNTGVLDEEFDRLLWGKDGFKTYEDQSGKELLLKVAGVTDEGFLNARTPEGTNLTFKRYELKLIDS